MISHTRRNIFQWILGIGVLCLLFLLAMVNHLSRLEAQDHRNLRYLMWKAGLREYDPDIALSGMLHDHTFLENLQGTPISEFHALFPSTFRVLSTPPGFGKESTFLTDAPPGADLSYAHLPAQSWIAHFRHGKLDSFDHHKGVP